MEKNKIALPDYKGQPPIGGSAWAWLRFLLKPLQGEYIFCFLFNVVRQCFFRSQPLFLGILVGLIESDQLMENPWLALYWFVGYGFASMIAFISLLYLLPKSARVMDRFSKYVSLYGFKHYLTLSESWHENRASGEKLQRLLKARDSSYFLLEETLWRVVDFPAIALSVFLSIIWLDAGWYYIPIFYMMIISYIIAAHTSGQYLKKRYATFYKTQEDVVGSVYEFLTSTSTVRFFNLKSHILRTANTYETINHKSRLDLNWTNALRWLILDTLSLAWVLLIAGLATYDIFHDNLSISAYTTIVFTTVTIWFQIEVFALLYAQIIDHWEGFKRLTTILNQEPAIKDDKNATPLYTSSASIAFKDVSFRYQSEAAVLKRLDLKIKPQEKIGLLGPSGAGKSTLIKLLNRFYDVNNGQIEIDGHNITTLTQESIQQHIAIIPQDIVLFNHSLMDNIRYGNLNATDEEVIEAARRAHALEFIETLPDGFKTIVGERGVKLSGGQRQRIAIARAILKDAPILILDEATSALDSESEVLLQDSLEKLMVGKTVIAIAHRLSTIQRMDRLIVMDQGRIIESGTHAELIKEENGVYAKLWSMQSGGFLQE